MKIPIHLFCIIAFCIANCAQAQFFQDGFESNTTVSTAAWPDLSGDYDPDNPAVGSWTVSEDGPQFAHELEVMGIHSNERVGRVVEGAEILRRLWNEDKVTHSGDYYKFKEVTALPKPIQIQVPIRLTINPKGQVAPKFLESILKRVAEHFDVWQTDAISPNQFRNRFRRIQRRTTRV